MCRRLMYLILLVALFAGSANAQFITSIVHRNGTAPEMPEIAPDPLDEDVLTFVDRNHEYNDIPESLLGAQYVKLANDDKGISAYELDLTFAINSTLYVFVDNRMGSAGGGKDVDPDISGMGWLNDMGFVDTGEDIGIDEGGDGDIEQYFSIFALQVEAGTVTIFGNTQGHGGNMLGAAALGPKLHAHSPEPEDEAIYSATWVNLVWTAGDTAATHDVYFSDNFDDVNDGTGDAFRGNQGLDTTFFTAGFFPNPYPDGLVTGTTYYWRVDEIEADGTTMYRGNVWSFWIPPKKAYEPDPADGAKFVDMDTQLSWTAGFGAKLHTVYFSDNFDDVNDGTAGSLQGGTTFSPGVLELDKTYYWRVDELEAPITHKGEVWSFTTTLPGLGSAVMDRWENIATTDINTLKNNPNYPNNPDVTETVESFRWDGADLSDYGARIEAWLYVPLTGEYTFWLNTDDQGELLLSTDDDSSNGVLIAQESSYSSLNSWGSGEERSDPITLVGGEKYYIMAIWKEGGGGDHCQVAWQGPGVPDRVVIPGSNLSPFEPMSAFGAKPANRATGVTQIPALQWKAGLQAASHEVYFGTDEAAVANATKASPEYKGSKALGEESFEPGKLPWESTFYWRVDEVNAVNPDSPWIGSVWSFTTADFLIVDDFEDYDAGVNQIWSSWHDGLGVGAPGTPGYFAGNGTGSAVGDETTGSYTEETIVNGGSQSMPLAYDNNKQGFAYYSETELTLTASRDWTEEGVAELSLWFIGNPASVGSFVEGPVGTYTMTATGADIWNEADQFHYAFKTLTGAGTIVAQVLSVDDTDPWAKAGVMFRETLGAGSKFAAVYITPGSICSFQARQDTDASAVSDSGVRTAEQQAIDAPYWVKLDRDFAGNFRASYSADGSNWIQMAWNPQNIPMSADVYVGLALTSHDNSAVCEARFSNVTITGNAGSQWTNQDVGIASNDAEPLYVAISNSAGASAIVVHDDPAAVNFETWTEWVIPLQDLADQGIVLSNIDRIAIGLGTRGNATIPGGRGKMYIDDIRLYQPREAVVE